MRYGRFIHRFRWLIVILWVLGLGVSIPFAATIANTLQSSIAQPGGTESARVSQQLVDTFHQPASQVLVVFHSSTVPVTDVSYQAEVQQFTSAAQGVAHVISAQQQAPAADGRTTFVIVGFNQDNETTAKAMPSLQQLLPVDGPATATLTGTPAVNYELTHTASADLERVEAISLPITLLVLLIVFGTAIAAAMPLGLALFAVPVALAVMTAINSFLPLNIFVLNISTIMGLGISIDYSLFIVRRYREELAIGRTGDDAIGHVLATAGEAILFSAITVIIGFAGLILLRTSFMTAIGIGGALTVACSLLAALTLLPAALSILGARVNALRVPVLWRLTLPRPDQQTKRGFWHWLARAEMRVPVVFIVLVLVVVGALAAPVTQLNIGSSGVGSLPKDSQARQGLTTLTTSYGTFSANTFTVIARAPDGSSMLTASNLTKVATLSEWMTQQAHVTTVISLTSIPATTGQALPSTQQLIGLYSSGAYQQVPSLVQLVKATTQNDATLLTASSDLGLDTTASKQLLVHLRSGARAEAQGLSVMVGGTQAQSYDLNSIIYGNFPLTVLFILIATYLLLLLMLRSLLLPLKAIIMTGLSVSAAFGAMVFVFQQGHLHEQLNFTPNGFVDNVIPILMFCLLFGLSMDYEVFLVSRMREEWRNAGDSKSAVAHGLERAGGVVTNAALLFIIVAGSFIFTRISEIQEVGLGLAVAVFVDAFLVRTLLVPAVMRLLGRANWWFPFAHAMTRAPTTKSSAK
jgi:RND superfamily putative drug exporter